MQGGDLVWYTRSRSPAQDNVSDISPRLLLRGQAPQGEPTQEDNHDIRNVLSTIRQRRDAMSREKNCPGGKDPAADQLLRESRLRALEELRRLDADKDQNSFQYSSESDKAQKEGGIQWSEQGVNQDSSIDSLDTLDRALAVRF